MMAPFPIVPDQMPRPPDALARTMPLKTTSQKEQLRGFSPERESSDQNQLNRKAICTAQYRADSRKA